MGSSLCASPCLERDDGARVPRGRALLHDVPY